MTNIENTDFEILWEGKPKGTHMSPFNRLII